MSKAFKIAQNHPISTISYILYTLFCYMVIDYITKTNAAFENIKPGEGVKWGGQGELLGFIFTFLFSIVFIITMILNALLRKTKQGFYWWMCLLIAIPFFILIGAVYLLHTN